MLALWHALDSTEIGLTKQDIRDVVPGYNPGASQAAFDKMFTRDKTALRDLGAVLETRGAEDGTERYLLATRSAPKLDLTMAERAAISLAASFWAAGELGAAADSAARRVTAAGRPIRVSGSLIAHIPTSLELLKPLIAAVASRRRVVFRYRSGLTGEITERVVEPWQVVYRGGGWYLLGRDVGRHGPRAFRLSRIVGAVKAPGGPGVFTPPREIDAADMLGETGHLVTATFALATGPGAAARLRAVSERVFINDDDGRGNIPAGFEVFRHKYDDEREFADELAGLGDQAVVLGPPQLREAVVRRLEAAARLVEVTTSDAVADGMP